MSNLSYCEQILKAPPFDWRKYLQDRIDGVPVPIEEKGVAYSRAREWVTCACGSQCSVIPRYKSGQPKDVILAGYGIDFMIYIQYGEWDRAMECLDRIELRSAYLIQFHEGK